MDVKIVPILCYNIDSEFVYPECWHFYNDASKIDDVLTEHGGVVAHEILVSSQGPLVFFFFGGGFGAKGLGPGLDNLIREL